MPANPSGAPHDRRGLPRRCIQMGGALLLLAALAGQLAAAMPAGSLREADAGPWRVVVAGDRVRVCYRPGHEAVARRAAAAAAAAASRTGAELGFAPTRTVLVYLHPTHQAFTRAIGVRRRELIVGIAAGALDVAHVDGSGGVADVPVVVAHEVAHLLLAQAVGEGVPRWFDEGYAEHASGRPEWAARDQLAEGLATGRLPSLAELETAFPHGGDEAAIAYARSHALVTYVLRHAPPGALREMARRMRSGEGFEEALAAAAGRGSEAWDAAWRADFSGSSRWQRWATLAAGASGLVMVLLCLVAYLAVRRHKESLPD